jgi:phosphatidylglycerophosphate synthase
MPRRSRRHLLRGLVKDTEGFMSKHVERRISLAVSRLLADTRVTPNAMTLFSVAIGLAGAPFFLSSRPALQTAGALLFLLHSILDGCDGELARLRFQESRYGGLLDFWGDNVVHVAVFAAMAAGWHRAVGGPWPVLCGVAAVAGTLASAVFVYRTTMSEAKKGPLFTSVATSQSPLARLVDAVSRRDFIYLVLILSAFGKAHWFVVLTALGAPIFFLALVGIAWSDKPRLEENA